MLSRGADDYAEAVPGRGRATSRSPRIRTGSEFSGGLGGRAVHGAGDDLLGAGETRDFPAPAATHRSLSIETLIAAQIGADVEAYLSRPPEQPLQGCW